MRGRGATMLALMSAVALLSACGVQVDVDAERERLLETDRAFAKRSLEVGAAQAFHEYFTEDALQLPDGGEPRSGRDAIRDSLAGDFELDWAPEDGKVAASGDLGYTWGRYRLATIVDGEARTLHGKYVNVWQRGADREWRVLVDMGNESPAPSAAFAPPGP